MVGMLWQQWLNDREIGQISEGNEALQKRRRPRESGVRGTASTTDRSRQGQWDQNHATRDLNLNKCEDN